MLARLVDMALAQRLLVLVATLMLAAAGVMAYRVLPVDAYPDVSSTQVKIIIKAPGMTPEEVEARITTPIELEMLGIPFKRLVRSTSKYAIADITLDFAEGTDIYWARQQVGERLAGILRDLPPGASGGLAPITTPLGEMFMFTVEGEGLTLAERRTLLDWTIRPALRTLPGVADVNVAGWSCAQLRSGAGQHRHAGARRDFFHADACARVQQSQRRRRPHPRRRGNTPGAHRRQHP